MELIHDYRISKNKIHFSFHIPGAVCISLVFRSLIKLKISMKLYARVNYELLTMRIYFIYFMKEILKIHHLINVGEVYLKFMKQTMFLIFCYNFTCVKGTAMNSLICKSLFLNGHRISFEPTNRQWIGCVNSFVVDGKCARSKMNTLQNCPAKNVKYNIFRLYIRFIVMRLHRCSLDVFIQVHKYAFCS